MLYHKAIASTQVRFRWPSGAEKIITLEIGAPFLSEKNDWRCELDLTGIEGETTAMIGRDSLEALCSSLYYMRLRIEKYRSIGVKVLYIDCEEDICLDVLFPRGVPAKNRGAQQASDGNAEKPPDVEREP